MRLGLLGLGRIGAFHAGTLASLPAVDSLVAADIVPSLTREVCERVGIEAAASPEAVLKSGIDGLVIAASTDAHPELIVAAIDAGLPVFCEKPIAPSIAQSVEVVRHVQAAGVPVQIGYQRRFDIGFQAAHAAVKRGELGWLHTVRSTTLDPAPPTPAYVAVSGGLFRDCGVHDFDIIRWVTGREVIEVYATGSNQGEDFFAAAGDVDSSAAVLTLEGGTLAVVSNTRYNPRGYDVRLEVHGSKDSIAVGLEDRLPLRSVEPGTSFPAGRPHPVFMERFEPAYRTELEVFAELVAGERDSPCTVADALEAEWIAEACTLSHREHRPVRIDEVKHGR
jgi:myo-inositol 2-dehydrogenase/D-chiro-inositol 1-dehydrogenase